jgi:photosynthetic reaction center cytochrome c subunit
MFTAGWVHPPILSTQTEFRGLALDQLTTPAAARLIKVANTLPDPIDPAPPGGDKATSVYRNVQVLNDLTVDQFNRVMLAMAEWVAPADQSCNYCHAEYMYQDDKYTKRVARRMLQMVRDINKNWQKHVGANATATSAPVGVVCYTCHRGAPVPKYTWVRGQ